MWRTDYFLTIVVLLSGVVAIVVGAVFIYQAFEKENWMKEAMRLEQVTLGLTEEQIAAGELIDTAGEAQSAADTIREHRRSIASSYQELLEGGQYDPTNPAHLSYAQALNMENYLYLAVLGFGVTTVIYGIGAFMIIVGIALACAGVVLFRSGQ